MTDRFHRIRALSFAAVGLSVAFGGCSRTEQQAEAPATTLAEQAEPPRLFPEGAFEPTMDAPLTLDQASMPSQSDRQPTTLQVPDADGGYFGEDQEFTAEAPTDISGENLALPPSDRTVAIETGDEEAPLPELLPFETTPALAEHATMPPADMTGEIVAPVDESLNEQQNEPDTSAVAEAPVAAEPAAESVAVTESAEVPAAPESATVGESAPLVSTGALAINNIKSVNAADRQVARLAVPVAEPAAETATNVVEPKAPAPTLPSQVASTPIEPASKPVPAVNPAPVATAPARPAAEAVAQQPASAPPVSVPVPVEPTPVAATPQAPTSIAASPIATPSQPVVAAPQTAPSSIAVTVPPKSSEAAAVTPDVAPLRALPSPSDVATSPGVQPPLDVATPAVRPTAPSQSTARSTATAPPTSVAIEQPADANHRAPLPAQAIPPQPALLAKSDVESSGPAAIRLTPSSVSSKPQQTLEPAPAARLPASPPARVAMDRVATDATPQQGRLAAPAVPQRVAAKPAIPARPAIEQPLVSRDHALPAADLAPPTRSAEMIAVSRLADEHTRRAFDLAGRRAMFSARTEFIEALQIMAHAIDAEQHTAEHSQALSDGLTAIKESDDFASHGGRLQDNIDVIRLARPHTTPVLKGLQPNSVSRLAAMQQYYTYAQRRLAFSVGREPSGSLALYGLGKLHSVLSQQPLQGIASAEPKAIIFHQAALLVDGRNYMAANDLGVLLARYGKYPQAKAALLHSLEVSPQPATWHNLTVVHQQLGEVRLAQLAHAESRAATLKAKQIARANGQSVTETATVVWLDPATFSRSSEMWSPPTPNGQPDAAPNSTPTTASKPANTPPAAASKRGFFRK